MNSMYSIVLRLALLLLLVSVGGFLAAGATGGATAPVLIGTLGTFAAGACLIAEFDTTPKAGHPRPPVRRVRP